jgi:hypothetical protein
MLEYQKSSAAFSLTAQLLVCVKFSGAITAVRSCVSSAMPPTPEQKKPLIQRSTAFQTGWRNRSLLNNSINQYHQASKVLYLRGFQENLCINLIQLLPFNFIIYGM